MSKSLKVLSKHLNVAKRNIVNSFQWQKIYLLHFFPFVLETFRQAKKQEISGVAAATILAAVLIIPFALILPAFIGIGLAGKLLR